MKSYHAFFISLVVLALLFSCNASTVIIDGNFEGKVGNQTIRFYLKRQAHNNEVSITVEEYKDKTGKTFPLYVRNTTLYDDIDQIRIYLSLPLNVHGDYKVLDNGARLESINLTPKITFKRK